MAHTDKNKDHLPANSEVTPKTSDQQHQNQDEYATPTQSEARNDRQNEKMRDSQQGDERMRPVTKGQRGSQKSREQHPQ
jgi:hypothetical protein